MNLYNKLEEINQRGARIAVRGIRQVRLYRLENKSWTITVDLAAEIPFEWLADIRVILGLKCHTEISYRTENPLPTPVIGDKKLVKIEIKANSDWEEAISKETAYCDVDSLKLSADGEERILERKDAESRELIFEKEPDENFGEDLSKLLQEQRGLNKGEFILENLRPLLYFFYQYSGLKQVIQAVLRSKIKSSAEWFKDIRIIVEVDGERNVYEVSEVEPFGGGYSLHLKPISEKNRISDSMIRRIKFITLEVKHSPARKIFRHLSVGFESREDT
jgi:hypothetical protein